MKANLRYDILKVRAMKTLAYLFLIFYAVTCLGPFVWSLMSAFKTSDEILVYPFQPPRALQVKTSPKPGRKDDSPCTSKTR